MTEPPLLEFRDVGVRREGLDLLVGVTFSVAPGTIHALAGPNGAGKSTLLAALLGQLPFTGRILAHWRRGGRVGYVPQGFTVERTLPMTVGDFLALGRQRRPVCLGRGSSRARVGELLATMGLAGFERRPFAALSGGERQRVLLANALDPEPELLLLDEPAAGLDAGAGELLEAVLRGARAAGTTTLLVTHDEAQVRRLADRLTVIDRGLRSDGPVGGPA